MRRLGRVEVARGRPEHVGVEDGFRVRDRPEVELRDRRDRCDLLRRLDVAVPPEGPSPPLIGVVAGPPVDLKLKGSISNLSRSFQPNEQTL